METISTGAINVLVLSFRTVPVILSTSSQLVLALVHPSGQVALSTLIVSVPFAQATVI